MEPGARSRGAGAPASTRADLAASGRDCGASGRYHADASGAVLLGATPRLHCVARAKGGAAAKSADPKLTPADQRAPSSTTERCSRTAQCGCYGAGTGVPQAHDRVAADARGPEPPALRRGETRGPAKRLALRLGSAQAGLGALDRSKFAAR